MAIFQSLHRFPSFERSPRVVSVNRGDPPRNHRAETIALIFNVGNSRTRGLEFVQLFNLASSLARGLNRDLGYARNFPGRKSKFARRCFEFCNVRERTARRGFLSKTPPSIDRSFERVKRSNSFFRIVFRGASLQFS